MSSWALSFETERNIFRPSGVGFAACAGTVLGRMRADGGIGPYGEAERMGG